MKKVFVILFAGLILAGGFVIANEDSDLMLTINAMFQQISKNKMDIQELREPNCRLPSNPSVHDVEVPTILSQSHSGACVIAPCEFGQTGEPYCMFTKKGDIATSEKIAYFHINFRKQ